MEKLRMLLNEFDPYIAKDGECEDNLWYGVACGKSAVFTKEIGVLKIISKEYEFIAWLIEKKHIKPYKAYKDFIDGNYIQFDGGECIPSVNGMLYDSILCGLAISDNPIELLISVLK